MKPFKDDILAKWKADSSITYIETKQELAELLKKDEKIKSKFSYDPWKIVRSGFQRIAIVQNYLRLYFHEIK